MKAHHKHHPAVHAHVRPPLSPVTPLPITHPFPVWQLTFLLVGLALWGATRRRARRSFPGPLFEINTRIWKSRRGPDGRATLGGFRSFNGDDLRSLKAMGINSVWFMGIWEIGESVRAISRRYGADYAGSPYAIRDYRISPDLGSENDFRDLVARAHLAGLSVVVDFIPNHMGLDSVWLDHNPEFFIHRVLGPEETGLPEEELQKRYPGYFPYHTPAYPDGHRRVPRRIMVAYGKDPNFYPWIDTAQLDYARPALRRKLIEVLCEWARLVDGVRCDMAMLVLRDEVKNIRHPHMPWHTFNRSMPQEFWPQAIRAAKQVNPDFAFIAETYWSKEGYLQHLGFDYTYDKTLYEAIKHAVHTGEAEGLMNYLRQAGTEYLRRSVHFIENHDEERAMNSLGDARQRPAAALICTLPGLALLHQGQFEGKREKLPVQRPVPLEDEPTNKSLHDFYTGLLQRTNSPIFREGDFIPLGSDNRSLASFARAHRAGRAIVIVNTSEHAQKGMVSLTPGLHLSRSGHYHLRDLYGAPMKTYTHPGEHLATGGLYVELPGWASHIFILEAGSR